MAEGQPPPGAPQAPPPAPERVATSPARARAPRERLAHLALDAALSVEGVAAPAQPRSGPPPLGPLFLGVNAVAEGPQRYAITLHLVAGLVHLPSLADAVRAAVARAAQRAGLDGELGSIDVRFEALETPE